MRVRVLHLQSAPAAWLSVVDTLHRGATVGDQYALQTIASVKLRHIVTSVLQGDFCNSRMQTLMEELQAKLPPLPRTPDKGEALAEQDPNWVRAVQADSSHVLWLSFYNNAYLFT